MKTDTFRSMFYILLTFVLYHKSWFLVRPPDMEPQFIWLARIPYFFASYSPGQCSVLFFITLFFILTCIFKNSKTLRALACFFFILLFSIKYSFGKINHSVHMWFFASFFFIFIDERVRLNTTGNRLVLRLIQSTQLLSYFCSGIWKIIKLEGFSWGYFESVIMEHIAYAIAEDSEPVMVVIEFFVYQCPWLLTLGFIFVIGFQIFSIVPIIMDRYFISVGLCAIFFHTMNGIIMGATFVPAIIAALWFLVYAEWMLGKECEGKIQKKQVMNWKKWWKKS